MLDKNMRPSPIVPTIDLDAQGVQHGYLRLPYSRDDSAWGSVMIPICVIRNGSGPTALLTGGNHGDEGQAGAVGRPGSDCARRRADPRHGRVVGCGNLWRRDRAREPGRRPADDA